MQLEHLSNFSFQTEFEHSKKLALDLISRKRYFWEMARAFSIYMRSAETWIWGHWGHNLSEYFSRLVGNIWMIKYHNKLILLHCMKPNLVIFPQSKTDFMFRFSQNYATNQPFSKIAVYATLCLICTYCFEWNRIYKAL